MVGIGPLDGLKPRLQVGPPATVTVAGQFATAPPNPSTEMVQVIGAVMPVNTRDMDD